MTLQPSNESVVANFPAPSDFLVESQISGLGTVHPLLTLHFLAHDFVHRSPCLMHRTIEGIHTCDESDDFHCEVHPKGGNYDVSIDLVVGFQIGAGLYAVGRPVQKKNDEDGQIGTIQSLPLERGALFNRFFRWAGPWTPSCGWRGFWPYRGMSRRIPDRQPRLGLATCVRQK